jgi:hypothetical protein
MSSPVPTVKRSKATKIKELVEDPAVEIKMDDIALASEEAPEEHKSSQDLKSPVAKKKEPKVPGAPKNKRKAEAPPDIEVQRCDAVACEAPAPKKQRAKKPKVAGFMSCVDNDHVLFKTHKEAYDYWRGKQGEGDSKGGIFECDFGKSLDFLTP